jgi:hypothetical protein
MAKSKAPPIKATPEMIGKAADTSVVKSLVRLAEAFARAGAHGPFTIELPLFCACAIKDKGYRRHSVPSDTKVDAGTIKIGKRDGLIFLFPINGSWTCDKGEVDWIELSWEDVINTFADLADRIEGYLNTSDAALKVEEIDAQVRTAIEKNAAMHEILSKGFESAQLEAKEVAKAVVEEENPLWGAF